MSVLRFAIITKNDYPIYEVDFAPQSRAAADKAPHLQQFVLHAALDNIEDVQWHSSSSYLKSVDKFNTMKVNALVTPGNTRLLLLHDGRQSEDNMRLFLLEICDLYVKVMLNPLRDPDTIIKNARFEDCVQKSARRLFSL